MRHVTKSYIRARNRMMLGMSIVLVLMAYTTLFTMNGIAIAKVPVHTHIKVQTSFPKAEPAVQTISYQSDAQSLQYEILEAEKVEFVALEPEPALTDQEIVVQCIGTDTITAGTHTFTRRALPQKDYNTFQPFEDYHCIQAKSSPAYKVVYSESAYTDSYGFRRSRVSEDQFSIDGRDDYMVAMGTYYKPKGTCGSRFLIITDIGMFTVITGDEKSDLHTDPSHMYTVHGNQHQYAGVLEYLVDYKLLPMEVKSTGSCHNAPIEPINGNIQMIYAIN